MNTKDRIATVSSALQCLAKLQSSLAGELKAPHGTVSPDFSIEERSSGFRFLGLTRLGIRFDKTQCVEFRVLRIGFLSIALNTGLGGAPPLAPLLEHIRRARLAAFLESFNALVVAGNRLGAAALYKAFHGSTQLEALEKADAALEGHRLGVERARIEQELPRQQRILEEYRELHGDLAPQARIG